MSDEKAIERLRGLREACGYIQNGSADSLVLYQDEATKTWIAVVGKLHGQRYYASGFNALLDQIAAAYPKGFHA